MEPAAGAVKPADKPDDKKFHNPYANPWNSQNSLDNMHHDNWVDDAPKGYSDNEKLKIDKAGAKG